MTDEEYVIILKNCASMLADGIKYLKEEQQKQFKEAYERAIEKLSAKLSAEPQTCTTCEHSDEIDGEHCYECVKGMKNNFEPCEDTVSRTAVIKAIKDWWSTVMMAQGKPTLCEDIKALPSVKAEPQTAEWEVYEVLHGEWDGTKKYKCPCCGHKVGVFNTNFCPECGVKMNNGKSWERSKMKGGEE